MAYLYASHKRLTTDIRTEGQDERRYFVQINADEGKGSYTYIRQNGL